MLIMFSKSACQYLYERIVMSCEMREVVDSCHWVGRVLTERKKFKTFQRHTAMVSYGAMTC